MKIIDQIEKAISVNSRPIMFAVLLDCRTVIEEQQKRIEELESKVTDLSKNLKDRELAVLVRQEKIDELESELQKQVGLLEAELQSERWNKEAGFKMFFKARDMRGGWNGFECKPEFYDVGGYWYKGGKSHYLYGDEWCDKETALNSLQAFGGDECE